MLGAKQKLLLVDDSREDRFLIKQALIDSDLHCEIEEAWDGEEAELCLARCVENDALPDLVILDLSLPKRSGIEILERLSPHELGRRTKIIVLSSLLSEREQVRLRELGVDHVFTKPIDLHEFLALGTKVKNLALPTHA